MKLLNRIILGLIIFVGLGISVIGVMTTNGTAVVEGLFTAFGGAILWLNSTNNERIYLLEQKLEELSYLEDSHEDLKCKFNRMENTVAMLQADIEDLEQDFEEVNSNV